MMSVIKGDEAQRLQELRMDLLFQVRVWVAVWMGVCKGWLVRV